MNRKDIQALLAVLGILLAVVSWQFVYKPYQAKAEQVKTENAQLRGEVNKLEELEQKKEEYQTELERMKEEGDSMIQSFAQGLLPEDQIMYLYNMELVTANEVVIPSIGMGGEIELPYMGITNEEGYQLQDEGIEMYAALNNVGFTTTNSGIKNVIRYIYSMPGRKAISNISMITGENGYLSGSMSVQFYYLKNTGIAYTPADIPAVSQGTQNIFGIRNQMAENQE